MSHIYLNDDYAGMDYAGGSFYYGYETTKCSVCNKISDSVECEDHEDEEQWWCFVWNRPDHTPLIIPCTELGLSNGNYMQEMERWLLAGISIVMSKLAAQDRAIERIKQE